MNNLARVAGLVALPLLVGGCLMSEQVGKPPGEVCFHYVSVFNLFLLLVRLAMVAILARLGWTFVRDRPIPWPLLVPTVLLLVVTAGWSLWGVFTTATWRVRCGEEQLTLHIPGKIWRTMPWEDVYGMRTEGKHTNYGGGSTGGILDGGYTEWEETTILLVDRELQLDLGRLSMEQRGNLVEIIETRAEMSEIPDELFDIFR